MNAPLTERQLAALQLTRNPRIATEVCKGIQYPCMCCGTIRHDVLWEYDLDRREVLAVTCVDRDACEERYVACNFRVVQGKGGQAGNCYYVWTSTLCRCDELPLTETDFTALRAFPRGQVHTVTGNPGDLTATVHSEVDSSD